MGPSAWGLDLLIGKMETRGPASLGARGDQFQRGWSVGGPGRGGHCHSNISVKADPAVKLGAGSRF